MRQDMNQLARKIQDEVCAAVQDLDSGQFDVHTWERPGGGGGESRVLQDSDVFEKAGVNVSAVHGTLSEEAMQAMRQRRGPVADPSFFATGVSLVLHPRNPFCPTVHANFRFFDLANGQHWWFGGGADLTPAYLFEEDARHFHATLKGACDDHSPEYYPKFKAWCDSYFRIEHRGECRGIGGIFFDDLDQPSMQACFSFVSQVADAFVPAYFPIARRRVTQPYESSHKAWQEIRRGRYVEFNLVYDRGTTFGLKTNARTESVLMSLPLHARWVSNHSVDPESEEARLLDVLRNPRDWAS